MTVTKRNIILLSIFLIGWSLSCGVKGPPRPYVEQQDANPKPKSSYKEQEKP